MSTHAAIATTALGVVEAVQLTTPTPGPGEVLIEIAYGAMIAFDTYQVDRGTFVQAYPNVLGFSGSGRVKSVGEGVGDLKKGDRVTAFTFPQSMNKSLQEYTLVQRAVVAKIPDSVRLVDAAAIPDNFVTAFWTLFKNLDLPIPETLPATDSPPLANEPILIYGASSSAGQYMIQLLRLAGYRNIVATASERNHEHLKSLGATHTFDYRSKNLTSELQSVTNGKVYKLAVDIIAAKTSLNALSKVLGAGTIFAVLLPIKEGDSVTNHPDTKMASEIEPWVESLLPGVDIRAVGTFRYLEDAEMRARLMPQILPRLLEQGILEPNRVRLLAEGTLLERVEQGLDLLRNNEISGEKVVVAIKPQ